ncbi:MAG: wax ester/triacylglycerol synthase family O-acyltransferase [Solirubrobacterales bacterium]
MRSHLSPLDATFLEIEEADAVTHMHVGAALVFDPVPGSRPPSLARLRAQLRARIEDVSILRRHLSLPGTGHALPVWIPDPSLDIGQLIRRESVPQPGGESELMEWVGDYLSVRLDRSLPLWEVVLLEGLEDGRWALVFKFHHCLVDGISGVNLIAALLDAQPEPEEGTTTLAQLVTSLGEEENRAVLARLRGVVGEDLSGGIDAAIRPHDVSQILDESRAMAARLAREEPTKAPPTSINRPIGAGRRLAAVDVPLGQLERVSRGLGGTVGDVVTAATAGGLRALFAARGEHVSQLRAVVPIGLRQATESLALGNSLSSLLIDLAIAEDDPLRRYRMVAAATSELRGASGSVLGRLAAELSDISPPVVQSVMARLAFTPNLFNVLIANGPGAPITLYSLGAPLRRIVPTVPIFSGQAISAAAMGYDGRVFFGLNADRDSVPDLDLMRAGIEETLHDLSRVAA